LVFWCPEEREKVERPIRLVQGGAVVL
jgi:hypothetical protein